MYPYYTSSSVVIEIHPYNYKSLPPKRNDNCKNAHMAEMRNPCRVYIYKIQSEE
jgi:hypothetical protein